MSTTAGQRARAYVSRPQPGDLLVAIAVGVVAAGVGIALDVGDRS